MVRILVVALTAAERLKPTELLEEPAYRCVERGSLNKNSTVKRYAYAVMVGPISETRRYSKWLYPIVALRRALAKSGSRADVVVLAAVGASDGSRLSARMTEAEEALLAGQEVRVRYVAAPGIRGFHMGHYKLWAWQHTEYDRIQLLDADVLPLTNMDRFFEIPVETAFLGCPGKNSVVNAGWFLLKPSCDHFRALTTLLNRRGQKPGVRWHDELGWGTTMPEWRNAVGRQMPPGYDFFDAKGNQGHMYAYFRWYANDIVLVYSDVVQAVRGGITDLYELDREASFFDMARATDRALSSDRGAVARALYDYYPCPFALRGADLQPAYHHFTGNVKPWTRYNPTDLRFKQWYDVLAETGLDPSALFNASAGGGGGVPPAPASSRKNTKTKARQQREALLETGRT